MQQQLKSWKIIPLHYFLLFLDPSKVLDKKKGLMNFLTMLAGLKMYPKKKSIIKKYIAE